MNKSNKNNVNPLNKLAMAISLSVASALYSLSALALASDVKHELHTIEIDAEKKSGAHIVLEIDGQTTEVNVPIEVLHDRDKLANALSDLPLDKREKVLAAIDNLQSSTDIEIHSDSDTEHVNKKVVVIEMADGDESTVHKKVIKNMSLDDHGHHIVKMKHKGKVGVDSIINMLKHGDYSAEELNQLQQALDAKR